MEKFKLEFGRKEREEEMEQREEAINAYKELVNDTIHKMYHGRELLIRKEETDEEKAALAKELDGFIKDTLASAKSEFGHMSDERLLLLMVADMIDHFSPEEVFETLGGE